MYTVDPWTSGASDPLYSRKSVYNLQLALHDRDSSMSADLAIHVLCNIVVFTVEKKIHM